ncbi:unnamed protein product [Citrullus colocynthis]|uniref:Protein kinase domain-containing protein n=1 Tax=Citrullus colocynthis TaxID=252529 RepID=A0ABP0YMH2_9ROSI
MGRAKLFPSDESGHDVPVCAPTSCWQAAELRLGGRQTCAPDLFSLGCILFYCITGVKHPFCEDQFERDDRIVINIPKASDVLQLPLFWSSEMRLSFLRDSSNRIHLEKGGDLLSALEGASKAIFSTKWSKKMMKGKKKENHPPPAAAGRGKV